MLPEIEPHLHQRHLHLPTRACGRARLTLNRPASQDLNLGRAMQFFQLYGPFLTFFFFFLEFLFWKFHHSPTASKTKQKNSVLYHLTRQRKLIQGDHLPDSNVWLFPNTALRMETCHSPKDI